MTYTTAYTHAGLYHTDDVVSTALLQILFEGIIIKRVNVVPDDINPDTTIVFDIGGGRFDHHQKDAELRPDGNKYAAAGLLWREFGELLVSPKQAKYLDNEFFSVIDFTDNTGNMNMFSAIINESRPLWDEDGNMEDCFWKAVDFVKPILQRKIEVARSRDRAELEILSLVNPEDEVVYMEKQLPWKETLTGTNVKFVIGPSLRGGYNILTINEGKLPCEWYGSKNLPQGISFCHPGGFMAVAETKELAMEIAKSLC